MNIDQYCINPYNTICCESQNLFHTHLGCLLVNLKKAGMASQNIVIKKQYTLFQISFAVVFGLLVFVSLYFG